MKKTTIDAKLLPNMWLFWNTTKSAFYLNCATGEKKTEPEPWMLDRMADRRKNRLINSGSKPRFAYAKYHEDIERLELAEVTIDTTRKGEPHPWKYAGNKYFLGKDKSVVDEKGNVCTENFILSQYHVGYNFSRFLSYYYQLQHNGTPVEEFKKLIGSASYTVGSGRSVNVQWTWHIQEWYKTKQKVRGAGREQKLVDKLVQIPLSDVSDLGERYPIKKIQIGARSYYTRNITGIIYFERLSDGWSVLRMFNRSEYNPELHEYERMYLHDNGTNRITSPSKNGWVPAKSAREYWQGYQFVNKEEAMQKCNRLKYIIPLFDNAEEWYFRNCIMTTLRFPEVEQLMKLNKNCLAMCVAKSKTPRAEMKNLFGYYNDKGNSLLKKIGMNKHQFDVYTANSNNGIQTYYCRALHEMREMFGNDFVHLDNATFDKYFHAFVEICRVSWGRPFYNLERITNIDRNKFIKNLIRLGEKNAHVYGVVHDTVNQYSSLNTGSHPEINWYFDSYSDVIRAHNAIDELKRAQDAERRAMWDASEAERIKKQEEKRIKMDEKRKEYEYEDENFIIRLPKNGNEIVSEGSMQRICIGGYVQRHSMGGTNLFFLRKKSEPDIPFYAIEMNNMKEIIQIHGYCNKWLGNNPEVIPTVVRWLRKNGIKCNEKILTCVSTGYGATNNYVKMPVVD